MPAQQRIAACLQLIERMYQLVRAGKWQKLPSLESEYASAFEQLKKEIGENAADATDLQAMIRLEQQQRRLQRLLSLGLKETGEKLSVIEDARKKLLVSSQIASSQAL